MVSFAGSLQVLGGFQEPPGFTRSPALDAYVYTPAPPYAARATALPLAAPLTDTQPVSEPGYALAGSASPVFSGDFYERIHVMPGRLDLGNVISNQSHQVEVWNAGSTPQTLAAIVATGALNGLSLGGQAAPPLAFLPLQSRLYALSVGGGGDPVIAANYVFDFGTSRPSVAITGRRVVVWGFRPEWSSGITERMTWLTDVHPNYDGTEQRIRLRDMARRAIEYRFLCAGHDARLLESLTFGWGARLYCLPVWWEADFMGAISAGMGGVTVRDVALKEYRVGGLLVVYQSAQLNEVAEITAIAGNALTLKQPLGNAFNASARVMPAVLARLSGDTPYAHITDALVSGMARFEVDANVDRIKAEIGASWQGYAVLDERPERSNDVPEIWARHMVLLDYQTGTVAVDDTSGMPVIRRSFSWILRDRQAIHRWKQWCSARAGRATALWMPSFADDLELVVPASAGDLALRVKNTLSARYVGAHALRPALRIELKNGQVLHRRVTGITELDADTEALGLESALGVTVQPTEIRRLMWLSLVRLDADAVEFFYETDALARLQLTFKVVPQ